MMTMLTIAVGLVLAILCYCVFRHVFISARLPLPPGPKPIPIIGNIRDFPPKDMPEFQHLLKHKDAYGPISSVTVLGQKIVIIHDREVARYLLEEMSVKTSARPQPEFGSVLCGFEQGLLNSPFNRRYRSMRTIMQRHLGSSTASAQYHGVQEVAARRFLLRILDSPEDIDQHIRRQVFACIFGVLKQRKLATKLLT